MHTLFVAGISFALGMGFVFWMNIRHESKASKSSKINSSPLQLSKCTNGGVKPLPTTPRPPAPPPQQPMKYNKMLIWLDMDAEYFALEDTSRTPMKIKWVKDGLVRLESNDLSHMFTGNLDAIHEYVTIISE